MKNVWSERCGFTGGDYTILLEGDVIVAEKNQYV